jgi:hypothetical protein
MGGSPQAAVSGSEVGRSPAPAMVAGSVTAAHTVAGESGGGTATWRPHPTVITLATMTKSRPGSLSMDDRTFLPQVLGVLEKAFAPDGTGCKRLEWCCCWC